jgi:hypothetical protein
MTLPPIPCGTPLTDEESPMRSRFLSTAALAVGLPVAMAQAAPPEPPPFPRKPVTGILTDDAGKATVTSPANKAPNTLPPTSASPLVTPAAPGTPIVEMAHEPVMVMTDSSRPSKYWASAEFLIYFAKDSPLQTPLVTTGPAASRGVLGAQGTNILIGGNDVDYGTFYGFRTISGMWIDDCRNIGVESTAWFLGRRARNFGVQSDANGNPLLARPFFNAAQQAEDSVLVSIPGVASGGVIVNSSLGEMYGGNWDLVINGYRTCNSELNVLVGGGYISLEERLRIFQGQTLQRDVITRVSDHLSTINTIFTGDLGLKGNMKFGALSVGGMVKVGLGWSNQNSYADGATARTIAGGPAAFTPAGVLVVNSNTGKRTLNTFVVVPEVNANVRYRVFDWLEVFGGYNFLYISNVARPGDQIERAINPAQIPSLGGLGGVAPPLQPRNTTDFYLHGASVGLQVRF